MVNTALKETLMRLLPRVQTPAQYMGGELNAVVKDHRAVRGTLCLAFPDTYALGTSHHGLQVLYTIMNADPRWACERAFAPWLDFEQLLREHNLPLYGLETFTPLCRFDVGPFRQRSGRGDRGTRRPSVSGLRAVRTVLAPDVPCRRGPSSALR